MPKQSLKFDAITAINIITDIATSLSAKMKEEKRNNFFWNAQLRITI